MWYIGKISTEYGCHVKQNNMVWLSLAFSQIPCALITQTSLEISGDIYEFARRYGIVFNVAAIVTREVARQMHKAPVPKCMIFNRLLHGDKWLDFLSLSSDEFHKQTTASE